MPMKPSCVVPECDGASSILTRQEENGLGQAFFTATPRDIEAVLLEHPGVRDAAAIGVPSQAWGETP
jgi:acyl-CoA synthetase (AMP-forming)/AMP-acid ligase II